MEIWCGAAPVGAAPDVLVASPAALAVPAARPHRPRQPSRLRPRRSRRPNGPSSAHNADGLWRPTRSSAPAAAGSSSPPRGTGRLRVPSPKRFQHQCPNQMAVEPNCWLPGVLVPVGLTTPAAGAGHAAFTPPGAGLCETGPVYSLVAKKVQVSAMTDTEVMISRIEEHGQRSAPSSAWPASACSDREFGAKRETTVTSTCSSSSLIRPSATTWDSNGSWNASSACRSIS